MSEKVRYGFDVTVAMPKDIQPSHLVVNDIEYWPIVRCKDCVKRHNGCPMQVWCGPDDNDFCSKGERYESDNEDTVADTEDSH